MKEIRGMQNFQLVCQGYQSSLHRNWKRDRAFRIWDTPSLFWDVFFCEGTRPRIQIPSGKFERQKEPHSSGLHQQTSLFFSQQNYNKHQEPGQQYAGHRCFAAYSSPSSKSSSIAYPGPGHIFYTVEKRLGNHKFRLSFSHSEKEKKLLPFMLSQTVPELKIWPSGWN